MKCPRCGSVSGEGVGACSVCGEKLMLTSAEFSAASGRAQACYADLRAGRITQAQYDATIQSLILTDPGGGFWSYQPPNKRWLWHDGTQWKPRKPAGGSQGSKTPIIIGAAAGFVLVAVIGIILFSSNKRGGLAVRPIESNPVAALIFAIGDQSPAISAYVGDPANNPFWVPAGLYYIEAMNPEGLVVSLGMVQVQDAGEGGDYLKFPTPLEEGSKILDETAKQQFQQLLEFMMMTDWVRVTYYEVITDNFQTLPYVMEEDIPLSALDPLYAVYDELAAMEPVMTAAADAFQRRALEAVRASFPEEDSGKAGLASPRQWISLLDKLRIFCGLPASAQTRAQQEIIKTFAAMPDEQKREALQMLEPVYGANTNSPDEFIKQVESGELQDWILRIRQDLYQEGYYQGTVQNQSGANRPGLDTARQEGAALVEAGANLYVEVIKITLDTKFPGIKEGFDYAEKVDKWTNYIRDLLNDPEVAIERFTLDQIKDLIKDNVKDGLQDINPGLSEDEIDEAAGVAADHIMAGIKTDMQQRIERYNADTEKTRQAAAEATAVAADEEDGEEERDYSWIAPYVSGVAGELSAAGYAQEKVNDLAGSLSGCLTKAVDKGKTQVEAMDNCADLIERFIKDPPPTEESYNFTGAWHSDVLCGEDDDPPYRWNVNLQQDANGSVSGTISFHACPGGGAAYYSVSGQNTGEKELVLQAERTDGRGDLWMSSMRSGEFRIEYMGPPQPNYAP